MLEIRQFFVFIIVHLCHVDLRTNYYYYYYYYCTPSLLRHVTSFAGIRDFSLLFGNFHRTTDVCRIELLAWFLPRLDLYWEAVLPSLKSKSDLGFTNHLLSEHG